MSPMSEEMVRKLLELGGVKSTPQEIDGTMRLYNTLDEQLAKVSSGSLEKVEPYYIQPTRRDRRRARP